MQRTSKPTLAAPPASRLVQLLCELGQGPGKPGQTPCFAERLGRLFDLSDTIALDTARRYRPPAASDATAGDDADTLQQLLMKTRQALLEGISGSFRGAPVSSTLSLPAPRANDVAGARPTFTPYERFYLAQQRQLISAVHNLRVRARRALTARSPALAQLAELDTVFDNTLSDYSRRGFAAVPALLKKRFVSLWLAHQKAHPEGSDPADWMTTGAWLQRFCQNMQSLLLAELETRLEPVLGLLEALQNEECQTP
ncbi:MAG: DUF3348 domain-containing protein [Alcanivorax sp.]|nr:DUF3348 domain-containing protein [Alcanivorax sp.]